MSIRGVAILLLSATILCPAQRMNDYLYPIREVGIPAKLNTPSERNPNGFPG
jgi:hypothetical protein